MLFNDPVISANLALALGREAVESLGARIDADDALADSQEQLSFENEA